MADPLVQESADELRPAGAERQAEERTAALAGETPARWRGASPQSALRDALIAALVAFALFGPLIGLHTVPTATGLTLDTRWGGLAIAVGLVFVGRLALSLFMGPRARRRTTNAGRWADRLGSSVVPRWVIGVFGALMLGLVAAMPLGFLFLAPDSANYALDVGIRVLTYVMLGWGLNIVVGLAGLLDLGYVAFYAVGAYSYALIATHFGWSFWICLPIAGLLAALWGIILGFPVLRLRGDYLAIVTLAFGEIIRIVLINWASFTGGPNGINRIPRPGFFGYDFVRGPDGFAAHFGIPYSPTHRFIFYYYLILLLALITNFVTLRIRRLPVGRAWEALREDEIACRSLGINTTKTKLTAFAMGAMFGGFAGSFFATQQAFISPESFNFTESATILAIVVLGGLGSQIGVAIAALVLMGGLELLRNLDFLKDIFGQDFDPTQYRMLIFGILMVLIMIWRPRGLVSRRSATVQLGTGPTSVSGGLVGEGRG